MFDPHTILCDRCRKPIPADTPGRIVFGEFIGHACESCAREATTKRRIELLAKAGIPAHFLGKVESMQARQMPADFPWLLIQGAVGTGKTHLAVEHLLSAEDPSRVRFIDWSDFIETRKAAIGSDVIPDPMPRVRPFGGILVIDDLGAESPTAYAIDCANLILTYRYNENLRTIITTNLDGPRLESVYGVRITSRIAGAAKLMSPKSKRDRRQKVA